MKCLKKNDHKITQKHRETNTEELMYDMVIFFWDKYWEEIKLSCLKWIIQSVKWETQKKILTTDLVGQEEEYPSKKTNPWKYLSQTKNHHQQQQKQKKEKH